MNFEKFIENSNNILYKRGYLIRTYFYENDGDIIFDLNYLYNRHPNGKTFSYNTKGLRFSDTPFFDISRWIFELFGEEMEKNDILLSNLKYRVSSIDYDLTFETPSEI